MIAQCRLAFEQDADEDGGLMASFEMRQNSRK